MINLFPREKEKGWVGRVGARKILPEKVNSKNSFFFHQKCQQQKKKVMGMGYAKTNSNSEKDKIIIIDLKRIPWLLHIPKNI